MKSAAPWLCALLLLSRSPSADRGSKRTAQTLHKAGPGLVFRLYSKSVFFRRFHTITSHVAP